MVPASEVTVTVSVTWFVAVLLPPPPPPQLARPVAASSKRKVLRRALMFNLQARNSFVVTVCCCCRDRSASLQIFVQDAWGDENQQFGFLVALLRIAEQGAESGHVAE